MSTPYNAGYVGSSLNQFSLQMINEYFVPLPNEFSRCTKAKWPNAKCLSSCKKVTNVNWSSKNATKPLECQKPLRIFRIQKLLFGLVKIIRKQLSPLGKTSWCFSLDPQKIVWLGFGIVVGTVKLSSLWFPSRCLELSPPDSKTVKITEKR